MFGDQPQAITPPTSPHAPFSLKLDPEPPAAQLSTKPARKKQNPKKRELETNNEKSQVDANDAMNGPVLMRQHPGRFISGEQPQELTPPSSPYKPFTLQPQELTPPPSPYKPFSLRFDPEPEHKPVQSSASPTLESETKKPRIDSDQQQNKMEPQAELPLYSSAAVEKQNLSPDFHPRKIHSAMKATSPTSIPIAPIKIEHIPENAPPRLKVQNQVAPSQKRIAKYSRMEFDENDFVFDVEYDSDDQQISRTRREPRARNNLIESMKQPLRQETTLLPAPQVLNNAIPKLPTYPTVKVEQQGQPEKKENESTVKSERSSNPLEWKLEGIIGGNAIVYDDRVQSLVDFMENNVHSEDVEIEVKIGTLLEKQSEGKRAIANLPVLSMAPLNPEAAGFVEFKSDLNVSAFHAVSTRLNQRFVETSQQSGSETLRLTYQRHRESVLIYEDRVRVFRRARSANDPPCRANEDPEFITSGIQRKERLQNMEFIAPEHEFDFRISASREQRLSATPPNRLPVRERLRDRLSYQYGRLSMDMTVVQSFEMQGGVRKGEPEISYEVELEILDSSELFEECKKLRDGEPNIVYEIALELFHSTRGVLNFLKRSGARGT
uniref:mRNA 5'-phosphatase n=1 Tax=Timspurckia oligopyrenoides TaxID=708627 RepID=A0A7S1ESV7_9RHOD